MADPAEGCGRPSAHGGLAQVALAFTTCAASSWQAAQSGLRARRKWQYCQFPVFAAAAVSNEALYQAEPLNVAHRRAVPLPVARTVAVHQHSIDREPVLPGGLPARLRLSSGAQDDTRIIG